VSRRLESEFVVLVLLDRFFCLVVDARLFLIVLVLVALVFVKVDWRASR